MDHSDLFEKCIEEGEKLGASYVELRYQDKYLGNFQLRDGELSSTTGSREGVCIRALVDGSWGLSSTNHVNKNEILKAINNAVTMAKNSSPAKEKREALAEVKVFEEDLVSPRKRSLADMAIEDKIQLILDASKAAKDFPTVRSLIINYNEIIDKRVIYTNEGTRVKWEDMKPTLMTYAVAIDEGKMASGYTSWSHTCGLEFFDWHPIEPMVIEASEKATRLVKAPQPPSGIAKMLLDPQLVGVLAHEAVGHTAEADLVQAGSFTQGKIGERVCDESITLIDTPFKQSPQNPWMGAGWLPFDDEGVKGKDTVIIENGIMKKYLVNRAFAHELNVEPTGNARAYLFFDEPIVRMRNTFIESGDMSFDELCEAIGNGYYLQSLQNGQADSSGEFMFGAVEAIEVKNGELTDNSFQNPVLTGNAFEVLSSIIGVGTDFEVSLGQGFCGKEQPAKVDAGGPHIAIEAMLAGGN